MPYNSGVPLCNLTVCVHGSAGGRNGCSCVRNCGVKALSLLVVTPVALSLPMNNTQHKSKNHCVMLPTPSLGLGKWWTPSGHVRAIDLHCPPSKTHGSMEAPPGISPATWVYWFTCGSGELPWYGFNNAGGWLGHTAFRTHRCEISGLPQAGNPIE